MVRIYVCMVYDRPMIRRNLFQFLFLLVIISCSLVLNGEVVDEAMEKREKRLQQSKVGDWVEYCNVMRMDTALLGNQTITNIVRTAVIQKDAVSVTLKTVKVDSGEAMGEEKVIFGKPRKKEDPNRQLPQEALGYEYLTVGGQDLDCEWTEDEYSSKLATGDSILYTAKIWTCDDIPVEGIVKEFIVIKPDPAQQDERAIRGAKTAVAGSTTTKMMLRFGRASDSPKVEDSSSKP